MLICLYTCYSEKKQQQTNIVQQLKSTDLKTQAIPQKCYPASYYDPSPASHHPSWELLISIHLTMTPGDVQQRNAVPR